MNLVYNTLITGKDYCFAFISRVSCKKHWILYTMLSAVLLSLFLSFPRKEILFNNYSEYPEVAAVKEKISQPFVYHKYLAGSHESKIAYRMGVPVFAHYLGLKFGMCRILEIMCGVIFFGVVAGISFRITGDKVSAVMMALFSGCIFAGTTSFIEFRGFFDGLAIFILSCSVLSKRPVVIFILILIASWIDERALIASSLVFLFNMIPDEKSEACSVKEMIGKSHYSNLISCFAAWVVYFLLRYILATYYGFVTDTGGVNLFLRQVNNLAVGIWTALEGGWCLVLLSFIYLFIKKNYFFILMYSFNIALIIIISMSVADITRSMLYMFPVLFIALKLLSKTEDIKTIRKYLFVTLLVSIIWPSYYVGGKENIWWHSPPFPIQIVRSFIFNK